MRAAILPCAPGYQRYLQPAATRSCFARELLVRFDRPWPRSADKQLPPLIPQKLLGEKAVLGCLRQPKGEQWDSPRLTLSFSLEVLARRLLAEHPSATTG